MYGGWVSNKLERWLKVDASFPAGYQPYKLTYTELVSKLFRPLS
jgi:hypothetical protein